MNCHSYEEILIELARNRTLDQAADANLQQSALAHVNECRACELRLQDDRALTHRLDEMAREMKCFTAPARVEEVLRNTFRLSFSQPVLPARAIDLPTNQSVGWSRWALAAAAILLIVLGIAGLRLQAGRQSPPQLGPSETTGVQFPREQPPKIDSGSNQLASRPDKESTVAVKRKGSYRRATRVTARQGNPSPQTTATTPNTISSDSESEVATRFMPIGYAGPINLQDGGQLVRVELPRSAMLSMGLPVNMDRYTERVKADVLLGADGLARAIRFVQ
jgi:hypothetical protein